MRRARASIATAPEASADDHAGASTLASHALGRERARRSVDRRGARQRWRHVVPRHGACPRARRAVRCGAHRSVGTARISAESNFFACACPSTPRRGSPKPSLAKLDRRRASQAGRQNKRKCMRGAPRMSAVAMRAHRVSLFRARGEGEYGRRDLGRKAELGLDDLLLQLVAVLLLRRSRCGACTGGSREQRRQRKVPDQERCLTGHAMPCRAVRCDAVRYGAAQHAELSPRCVARVASCAARQREHGQRTAP